MTTDTEAETPETDGDAVSMSTDTAETSVKGNAKASDRVDSTDDEPGAVESAAAKKTKSSRTPRAKAKANAKVNAKPKTKAAGKSKAAAKSKSKAKSKDSPKAKAAENPSADEVKEGKASTPSEDGSGKGQAEIGADAGDAKPEGKSANENTKVKPEPEEPPVPIPDLIDLNEFQGKPLAEMQRLASDIGLRVAGVRSKHQLVFEILSWFSRKGARIEATGFIDFAGDSHGFLRWPALSFLSNTDDVYCAASFIREHKLKIGNEIRACVRAPRDREKFLSVESLIEIEGQPVDTWEPPVSFDDLTALFPKERLILEYPDSPTPSPRVVDLLAPLGKGQRGLIVAPPRAGKTILLKNIAVSIQKNHPEVELIVLLLDERPEEVTDFRETVSAPVFSSTFDEPTRRHVQVSDMVAQRARRLVEQKKDVVILLDSLTRLARGHNANIGKGGGRTGSGGLDTKALERPRKFFGAARNVEEGGSLTILATCLVETDSRMDEVIFEEFKGTGNMEIYLDRELAEKRIFPAIHGLKSGTRKDDLLYHPDEFKRISSLRRQLVQLPAGEAMEVLVKNIQLTGSNAELLLRSLSLR